MKTMKLFFLMAPIFILFIGQVCKVQSAEPADKAAVQSGVKSEGKNIICGEVRDQTGKPISGVLILPEPEGGYPVKTDEAGKFELAGPSENRLIMSIFAREPNRNLAAAVELNDCNKPVHIILSEGVIFSGRVTDPQGKPIAGASASPVVDAKTYRAGFGYTVWKPTDSNGCYEIKTLPVGAEYGIDVWANGYGGDQIKIIADKPGRQQLKDIVLQPANLSVSGIVLDENLEPVPGVSVQASGEHQPYREVETDSKGKFKIDGVCNGRVSLQARPSDKVWKSHGDEANGGESDVELYITKLTGPGSCLIPAKNPPASLVGKKLLDLDDLNIYLVKKDIQGKRVLVCFWNIYHDKSRDCIRQLAARSEELARKNIVIVAAEFWPCNEKQFRRWLAKNNIKFPASILPDQWQQKPEQRTIDRWGMQNRVPWLILTDSRHIVTAEGFYLKELDEKIEKSVPKPAARKEAKGN